MAIKDPPPHFRYVADYRCPTSQAVSRPTTMQADVVVLPADVTVFSCCGSANHMQQPWTGRNKSCLCHWGWWLLTVLHAAASSGWIGSRCKGPASLRLRMRRVSGPWSRGDAAALPRLLQRMTGATATAAQGQGGEMINALAMRNRPTGAHYANRRYDKVMRLTTWKTFWRVIVPSVGTTVLTAWLFPLIFWMLRTIPLTVASGGVTEELSFDSFVGNFLTIFGLLFSILGGSSYASLYGQNEAIYYAIFAEVSEAKALVEQVAMVCQGRPINDKVLGYIERYVREDLRQLTTPPSVMLATRPRDDPLESILYLTSVGVPSSIYETVRSLRQLRGQRLGAIQRKMPPIQIAMLWVLGVCLMVASPMLILDIQGAGRSPLVRILFGFLCGSVVLTLRVINELWNPAGGAYNVDGVLRVAVRGLEEEIKQRRQGGTFSSTDLPSPPP
eukprot:CAMPEP_0115451214 /NCGR_PEP_ID=MMETSP0271-20121206/41945_1 /TAXON_ID=71861 /ORGANISM="Scrippsiella trochoidea, Strain CCMP3099" /LENGTH=444 /DNA_ID=CAMNT_0002877467 /DNA_START=1529 /DNA_END=2860 /DNA_ORIENTATION=-